MALRTLEKGASSFLLAARLPPPVARNSNFDPNVARVCSVGCTGTERIFGGRPEVTDVFGTGIEFIPNTPAYLVPGSSSEY